MRRRNKRVHPGACLSAEPVVPRILHPLKVQCLMLTLWLLLLPALLVVSARAGRLSVPGISLCFCSVT